MRETGRQAKRQAGTQAGRPTGALRTCFQKKQEKYKIRYQVRIQQPTCQQTPPKHINRYDVHRPNTNHPTTPEPRKYVHLSIPDPIKKRQRYCSLDNCPIVTSIILSINPSIHQAIEQSDQATDTRKQLTATTYEKKQTNAHTPAIIAAHAHPVLQTSDLIIWLNSLLRLQ